MDKVILSQTHVHEAATRQRCELVYQDVNSIAYTNGCVTSYDMYCKRMWDLVDNAPNQVGSIAWDAVLFDQSALMPIEGVKTINKPPYDTFHAEGHDIFNMITNESHARGIEALLACRVGGGERFPDLGETFLTQHPELYIKDWDLIPNLENSEVRARKTLIYKRVLEKYDFDGIVIDYCRHTPFLTPGKQWEKRICVTEWMYDLRQMLNALENKSGHSLFLGARVSPDVEGCKQDGLDLAAWAENSLVDLLVLGDRCYTIDVKAFRNVMGAGVKLYPNLDAHHTTDGYFDPDLKVLNGTVHRWYTDGADGVSLFNWLTAREEVYKQTAGNNYKQQMAVEQNDDVPFWSMAGDVELINRSDKTFVVERRGGYPWENGFTNNNNQHQLPRILQNNGTCEHIYIEVTDISGNSELSLTLYGFLDADKLSVSLNGNALLLDRESNVIDQQIFPLKEAPISGFGQQARIPDNKSVFDVFRCALDSNILVNGKNELTLNIQRETYPYLAKVELERVHITVTHTKEQ